MWAAREDSTKIVANNTRHIEKQSGQNAPAPLLCTKILMSVTPQTATVVPGHTCLPGSPMWQSMPMTSTDHLAKFAIVNLTVVTPVKQQNRQSQNCARVAMAHQREWIQGRVRKAHFGEKQTAHGMRGSFFFWKALPGRLSSTHERSSETTLT